MSNSKIILRMGSHAEKEYFEKLARGIDGIIIGANLLEITPAATVSLLFSLKTKKGAPMPFYLDPMTYCYGPYIDSVDNTIRLDLEALKSERLIDRASRKTEFSVKESYVSIAERLDGLFKDAVNDRKDCHAIQPTLLTHAQIIKMCEDVIGYQVNRISEFMNQDSFIKENISGDICSPSAIFAPYFYIDSQWAESGILTACKLASEAVKLKLSTPIHAVICASNDLLDNRKSLDLLIKELIATQVSGVWFWFDGFDEFDASEKQLFEYRRLVNALSPNMDFYNMHGGYFSLLLSHDGLMGISHGVGYGEKKPVHQVIGEAAPVVRYYLPAIFKRVGVAETQRCFRPLGIDNSEAFFDKVCNCNICKGIIGDDITRFSSFGEMHRARDDSKRDSQTPSAAKMCRYHFLINRLREPSFISKLEPAERVNFIKEKMSGWRTQASLSPHLGHGPESYLERWIKALEGTLS